MVLKEPGEPTTRIESRLASMNRRRSFAEFVGDVVVYQEAHRLYCDTLHAYLTEEDDRVKRLGEEAAINPHRIKFKKLN